MTSTWARSTPAHCTTSCGHIWEWSCRDRVSTKSAGRVRRQPVLRPRDRSHPAAQRRLRRSGQPLPVPESLRDLVHGRLLALPPQAVTFLLAAAAHAHPTIAVTEAASGIDREAGLRPALEARVVDLDRSRIRFTHPLLAAGAYETADPARRAEIHARLAELLDDPEARAWQLAASIGSPDEAVADALEEAAEHARGRGALRSAALMLDRASELTPADRGDDAATSGGCGVPALRVGGLTASRNAAA